MKEKIALITGANKGIGYETALQLGKKGVHILLGSRNPAEGKQAVQKLQQAGVNASALPLDVTDSDSIHKAVDYVTATFGKLDILINNAGVMLDAFDKAPSQQSLAIWRKTFDVNVYGVVEVTNAFLDLIKKSDAGRIVNVSSSLGSMAELINPESTFYHFKIPAYNISKTALNAWTIHLAYELRETNVKVNAVYPGFVKTDLHGVDAPLTPAEGARTSVAMALLPDDGPTGQFYNEENIVPW